MIKMKKFPLFIALIFALFISGCGGDECDNLGDLLVGSWDIDVDGNSGGQVVFNADFSGVGSPQGVYDVEVDGKFYSVFNWNVNGDNLISYSYPVDGGGIATASHVGNLLDCDQIETGLVDLDFILRRIE